MFRLESRGSFAKTEAFLKRMSKRQIFNSLSKYGEIGVNALSNATPTRSGLTADSWYYKIERDCISYSLVWRNSNVNQGSPIAILIQYRARTE